MRRSYLASLLAAMMVVGGLFSTGAVAEGDGDRITNTDRRAPAPAKVTKGSLTRLGDQWVDGQVLVKYKRGVPRKVQRGLHAALGATIDERIRTFGVDVVDLPAGVSVADGIAAYASDPLVEYAEPNLIRSYAAHVPVPPLFPDDTSFPDMWGLNNTGQMHTIADPPPPTAAGAADADIDAPEAWSIEQGSTTPTIVGVVDSGVDVFHLDLAGQLWVNPGEGPVADGLDNDGNGLVDDINGWNFGGNNADLSDAAPAPGHGTHVAGTVAAAGHNAMGTIGVCPHCQIMVLKMGGTPTVAAELAAYAYAISKGAHIINGSFGGGVWSRAERDAIGSLGNANILGVYAAGNSALDNDLFLSGAAPGDVSPSFPASYTLANILAVAASNDLDQYGYFTGCALSGLPAAFCGFTNIGHDSVDVAAPGVDIVSTVPGGYANFDGTSMASPHVAGVAGLLKSKSPTLSAVQIKNAIMNSADRPPALTRMFSPIYKGGSATGQLTRTNGRVNAFGALTTTDFTTVGRSLALATPKTDGNVDGAKRINKKKKGRVTYPQDVNDVYRKRLRKGKFYEVTLDVPKRKDFDLWVWKPKTKEIWQLEAKCLGLGPGKCQLQGSSTLGKNKDETLRFKAKKGGKYYFHVAAWLKNKGRYTLTIKRV